MTQPYVPSPELIKKMRQDAAIDYCKHIASLSYLIDTLNGDLLRLPETKAIKMMEIDMIKKLIDYDLERIKGCLTT